MKITPIIKPDFEEIVRCDDPQSGLKAYIAVHSTRLGPALGGIRIHPYPSEESALEDVTRLARAMTFKAAAARIRLGGGKAVIVADPGKEKTPSLLRVMGRFVQSLNGKYISAKDVGITTEDLIEVSRETTFVSGLPESMGGSDDPSPWTARGVVFAIEYCVRKRLKKEHVHGLTVAIQGLGHVGYEIARLLHERNARLIVSDINSAAVEKAVREFGAKAAEPERIHSAEADIFSPCALGGVLNDKTIGELKCSIVAGGSNNQLLDEKRDDEALRSKNILYAPDYVINAGGIINIYAKDVLKNRDPMEWISKIPGCLEEITELAEKKKCGTATASDEITRSILADPSGNVS